MAKSKVTLVYYHIPTDQDEEGAPNVFPISKLREEIKLKDVKEKFPLPGNYHFRFKLRWQDGSPVWMDVTNDDSAVPCFEEKIVCKILRLTWGDLTGFAGGSAVSKGANRDIAQPAIAPNLVGAGHGQHGRCASSPETTGGSTGASGPEQQNNLLGSTMTAGSRAPGSQHGTRPGNHQGGSIPSQAKAKVRPPGGAGGSRTGSGHDLLLGGSGVSTGHAKPHSPGDLLFDSSPAPANAKPAATDDLLSLDSHLYSGGSAAPQAKKDHLADLF